MTTSDDLPNAAAKSISNALAVLEMAYQHGEQLIDKISAKLAGDLQLVRGGSVSERKEADEGKLRLRRFQGFYLCDDREVWRSPDTKAIHLRKPILFACVVARPAEPERVGGMFVVCGTLSSFEIRPGKQLKDKNADFYLQTLVGAFLDEDPPMSGKPVPAEFQSRHAVAKGKYFTARLVDLPDERAVMELAERMIGMWKSR